MSYTNKYYHKIKNQVYRSYKAVGQVRCPYLKQKVVFTSKGFWHIIYYGFIAIVDGWKVKVIVKKVGNGKPYFYSVIPNWVTNRKRDKVLHKGDMQKD